MAWIEYNGIRSDSIGALISKMPNDTRGARRYSDNAIAGRSSSIFIDDYSFESYDAAITFNCFGKCTPRDIYRWLSGEGYMITSDDPTKKRYVRFFPRNNPTRDRILGQAYDQVVVNMLCDPYMVAVKDTIISVTEDKVFAGNGDMDSEPLLLINGNGGDATIIINGTTIVCPSLSGILRIDCDAKVAYKTSNGVNTMYSNVEITSTDDMRTWAVVHPDTNTVSITGCTAMNITPRWRWY